MTATICKKDSPIYVYALIPAKEKEKFQTIKDLGIDGRHEIILKEFGQIAAVACTLDTEQFSKERIEAFAHDPNWINAKATHHHEVISIIHSLCTVLPLKFCTIYSTEASLKKELIRKQEHIHRLFSRFKNREGWNVKVYCHYEKMTDYVKKNNPSFKEKKEEMQELSPGKRFLMSKKLDLQLKQLVDEEIERLLQKSHDDLVLVSADYAQKKIWNKQVTGRTDEMVGNRVYLIDRRARAKFDFYLLQFEKEYEKLGFSFVCTGPWPPYDFLEVSHEK
jgi:hypothetical protein